MQKSDTNTDKIYSTNNSALSAYLLIEGYTLLDVEVNHDRRLPSIFIFENSNDLQKSVAVFISLKATGNINDFYEAYRKCLRMARVGKY